MWCITFMVQWIGLCKISAVFTTQFNRQLTVLRWLFDKMERSVLSCDRGNGRRPKTKKTAKQSCTILHVTMT